MSETSLIQADKIQVDFTSKSGLFQPELTTTVLSNISFRLPPGSILGVVGESGSGKTTLAKVILGLIKPSKGNVTTDKTLDLHRDIQFIFQDPIEALNPRMRVEELILEPLDYLDTNLDTRSRQQRLKDMMRKVGLDYGQRYRYPHEFSGGQCQRIGIARAMISQPKVLICDEPVSALDVSIRAQIIELLKDLQQSMNLSLIFIAHDLSLVRYISDQVLVLYKGRIMETGQVEEVFAHPQHPYTQDLIQAEPKPDPQLEKQRQQAQKLLSTEEVTTKETGCVYLARCQYVQDECQQRQPDSVRAGNDQKVACFYPLDTL